jgi:tRNA-splicing ligase RtcB
LGSVSSELDELANTLYRNCPCGMGAEGNINLNIHQIKTVCETGAHWAVKEGMGSQNDLEFIEENGCLKGADFKNISDRAVERGKRQMGTLGSGNHFIEVDVVEEVFDKHAADLMGIRKGCLTVMIHCGSRGLGHQVCTDYVQNYQHIAQKEKYHLPDRELVYAGLTSQEGQAYLSAMKCAANYAFANRQVLTHLARKGFSEVFGENDRYADLVLVYDLAHNIGKIENHEINGVRQKVCVHRKGATRAFGPHSKDIPTKYQKIGQPVFIPGSMGSASWVLTGSERTMEVSFGSLCHGAGRVMSRHQAKREVNSDKMLHNLIAKGVHLRYHSHSGLVEEAPQAYKDVDAVIKVVTGSGLAKKVARLIPVIVIKG